MSRPAKPTPDGEPPKHKVQYAAEHVVWLKARKAMKRNGVNTVSALVGVLLSREFERLGITDELVLAGERAASKSASKKVRRS